ncbi:GatB/YqeY domain-containing protein [Spongisporangium articulatum]|uniref:GatB/YqeY domain-containing protein n=1 Tax=Spongisporangium articulatum TaxID=3362603 RepID=A0ABW8AIT7_9ACTN
MSTTPGLKTRLQSDLTTAMKARDAVRSATIRMVLTAVRAEEVAGTSARELSDAEVTTVVTKEAKKRREAAQAYDDAGRQELANRERAELDVLADYLPEQLSDEQIAALVTAAVEAAAADGATGRGAMGAVMKRVKPQTDGKADGGAVAAEVRRQLGM